MRWRIFSGISIAQKTRQVDSDVRYTLEPLAQFNFSFSPGFSLGSQRDVNFGNRFNGFRGCGEIFNISMETVETVFSFQKSTDPRLKPGENEKLNVQEPL